MLSRPLRTPSLASQLPQVMRRARIMRQTQNLVGAGLPAKRPAHPTSTLPASQPSRTSSLPQGWWVPHDSGTTHDLWELACQRRGRHIQHQLCLPVSHREQARSHRGWWVPHDSGTTHDLWELACQRLNDNAISNLALFSLQIARIPRPLRHLAEQILQLLLVLAKGDAQRQLHGFRVHFH